MLKDDVICFQAIEHPSPALDPTLVHYKSNRQVPTVGSSTTVMTFMASSMA